jgi:hypothetical protein
MTAEDVAALAALFVLLVPLVFAGVAYGLIENL